MLALPNRFFDRADDINAVASFGLRHGMIDIKGPGGHAEAASLDLLIVAYISLRRPQR